MKNLILWGILIAYLLLGYFVAIKLPQLTRGLSAVPRICLLSFVFAFYFGFGFLGGGIIAFPAPLIIATFILSPDMYKLNAIALIFWWTLFFLIIYRKMWLRRKKEPDGKTITWTGNLNDDCSARWNGLLLRAEWMDGEKWWWAVYDMENEERTIDSSVDRGRMSTSAGASRQEAERVARAYIGMQGKLS